jgi:hypothetical protein
MFKKISESSENYPEQLTQTSENSPRLIADQLNLNQVGKEQPNRTWSLPFQPPILNRILNFHILAIRVAGHDGCMCLHELWNFILLIFPGMFLSYIFCIYDNLLYRFNALWCWIFVTVKIILISGVETFSQKFSPGGGFRVAKHPNGKRS